MKINDIYKLSSKKLNESIHKTFGKKLNLESFTLIQLEDARNKIRTQISQVRSQSSFNENLENDTYHQAQWMLDAINTEIAEREEFISDAGTAEASFEEGSATLKDEVTSLLNLFDKDANELGAYGTPDIDKIVAYLEQGETDSAADEIYRSYTDPQGGQVYALQDYVEELEADLEELIRDSDDESDDGSDQGGETDDSWALASAGFGDDEDYGDYGDYDESVKQENNMTKLKESEINQASAIVTANTMVDRVGRWIEELSGMENDTLLQLGDSIRDEFGQQQAKEFVSKSAPAIQQALENLKQTRETLASSVRVLTGEEQGAEMLGAAPDDDVTSPVDNLDSDDFDTEVEPDDFSAADAAAGGSETAGREKRESIERQNVLYKVLAG